MSVEAVKLPPHLKKTLDASKQRFKKTPLKQRMERAEKKRQENIENIQANARKAMEAATRLVRLGKKCKKTPKKTNNSKATFSDIAYFFLIRVNRESNYLHCLMVIQAWRLYDFVVFTTRHVVTLCNLPP